jgi:hypothetical protein
MTMLERYRGCLLGFASGDVLGSTLEFQEPGSFGANAVSAPASRIAGVPGRPSSSSRIMAVAPGDWPRPMANAVADFPASTRSTRSLPRTNSP